MGVRDNFFAIGGDSIRSIQVLAKAKQQQLSFTLEELFRLGTIEQLALAAAGRSGEPPVRRTAAGELLAEEDRQKLPAEIEDAYPLAELQAGMLFHSLYSPETAVYHDVFSSRITAAWDEGHVREAVAAAMRRHAVLRTSLAPSGYSRPLQLVHREVAVPLQIEDLRGLPAEQQEARVATWLQDEKQRAFDWSAPPLFLIQVHRLSDGHFQLSLSFHHAILDGWSVATLLAELFAEVAALGEGAASPIRAPSLSYRDFVALETAAVESPETRDYWQGLLAGHSRTQLPRLPAARGGLGSLGVKQLQLDPPLADGIKRLAQDSGVPLKSRAVGGAPAGAGTGLRTRRRAHRTGLEQPPGRGRRRARAGPVPQHAAPAACLGAESWRSLLRAGVPGRAGRLAAPPLPGRPLAAPAARRAALRDGLQLQPLPRLPANCRIAPAWTSRGRRCSSIRTSP